ncbi:CehA/McbA family metallohydrolase [Paenibacillaceae bacterium WGS1546]|uniref:CehA/McbA family metallohydrolase n=1 Tax=Cohnella sp. WGS1546 TaxID=3366810 RepID=UPI00372D7AC7
MDNPERKRSWTIERTIRHEEEREYYVEVPFELPERTEELGIEIEAAPLGEGRTVIDLGLKDPARIRGWSGGARTAVFVGREKATPGYLPGELTPGRWTVLLGAYRVPTGGCRVSVRVTVKPETARWLKGDLHAHTEHSDGTYTLREAGAIIEALGCDFLATTDHNAISQNYAHPQDANLVFIPGMELTTTRGHANLLGVPAPVDDFRAYGAEDIRRLVATAKRNKAFVVLNHPHCDMCPWEWGFDVDPDAVEVWNGPWTERNDGALAWWQEQLAAGGRLVAVGGSDAHRPHPYVRHAWPTTWVYANTRTVEGIMEGVRAGRVFLSYAPDGPTIDLTLGSCMIGDVYEPRPGDEADFKLNLAGLREGDAVKIVSERGVEHQFTAATDGDRAYSWPMLERLFYRVEVWRYFPEAGRELVAALSNPVYLRGADGERGGNGNWK